MAIQTQRTQNAEPFRWKLFLVVMLIMASLTTAAIILTLMANPTRGTVHVPPPQPISRLHSPIQLPLRGHQSSPATL